MIGIIDYGASNLVNVRAAFDRLRVPTTVFAEGKTLASASLRGLVLPGVGHARSAFAAIKARNFTSALQDPQMPVLGICLGLQLFCRFSEEGDTALLGRFPVSVRRISTGTVPRMGWADVLPRAGAGLLPDAGAYYFAHSYAVSAAEAGAVCAATTDEGFAVMLDDGLVAAVQFHPEKSGVLGAQLLRRFADRCEKH